MDDKLYQKKFEEMRQRHELDKKVLMARFQQHASSLQQHHQLQLQKHFELVLSQQKQLEALSQSQELANAMNKDKDKESAVASNAVKKHLQNFVIGRQKGKLDNCSTNHNSTKSGSLRWHHPLIDDVDHNLNTSGIFRPLYNEKCDFPLRKTASEPNLKVRSRLKQKLSMEQRSSPLLPRQDGKDIKMNLANRIKKKMTAENVAIAENKSLSGMNLSISLSNSLSPRSNNSPSTSNHVEGEFYEGKNTDAGSTSISDLYSSPSLPNINIGANKRPNDPAVLLPSKDEINRFVSRTASLPGPMLKLPHKQCYPLSLPVEAKETPLSAALTMDASALLAVKALPDYDKESASLPSSHGPIRASPITRTHRSLIRTQSAPTSVTSQLQQHILQKKQNKSLKLYQEQKLLKHGLTSTPHNQPSNLPVYYEQDIHKKLYNRMYENSPLGYYAATERESLIRYEERQRMLKKELPSSMSVDEPDIPSEQSRAASADNYSSRQKSHSKPINGPPAGSSLPKAFHRPLQRTQSSPAASFIKKNPYSKKYRYTTGVAYSPVMLQHGCSCGDDHTEHAGRLKAIWNRLVTCGLVKDDDTSNSSDPPCESIVCRKATTLELELVHTEEHILKYGTTSLARKELDLTNKLIVLPCGGVGVDNGIDVDTVWNEQNTVNAARMAVGCTVDLALAIAQNQLKNGFALVRPPGHHAEKGLAMAFCYFNSAAVAARKLQVSGLSKKILILDWDIHHCNGTQNIFYDDPTVLVISLHRYDSGNFFPGTGGIEETGFQRGYGYNVNIAFSSTEPFSPMGDAEYLAVFRSIVIPIVNQFEPDMVIISSGFSAASGHSPMLGGYVVSPQCYGYLTQMMMNMCDGKLLMVLEGGFELEPLCDCTEVCIRTLLGENKFSKLSDIAMTSKPNPAAVKTIEKVISVQRKHWRKLEVDPGTVSHAEWISLSRENETCKALASLTVNNKGFSSTPITNNKIVEDSNHQTPPRSVEEEMKTESSRFGNSHTDSSLSSDSSPLDVVNTSNPSSPSYTTYSEKFIKVEPPT